MDEALDFLRPGDTLVVWLLDRLGRSLRHLIDTLTALQARGISFRSLQEQIDTSTSGGKLVFHAAWIGHAEAAERANAGAVLGIDETRRGRPVWVQEPSGR